MLSKELRLDPKDIQSIARKGKRFDNDYFYIKAWFDDSISNPQFAISISIKIDKRSAVRNRIKRKIRASIMDLFSENSNIRMGKYLIVVKDRKLIDVKNEEIVKLLINSL